MNRYVSYGGGVNSTALSILLLTDARYEAVRAGLRFIMADTGDEWPETYAFVRDHFEPWLARHGKRLEWVKADLTLWEYCMSHFIIPSRQKRWCTDKFKIRPIVKKLESEGLLPTIQYLGIHAGEALTRMRTSGRADIINDFPLCYDNIDQQRCIEIIASEGLPIPMKSGCFYCPHSRKQNIIDLEAKHPALFERAVTMEANNSGFNRPKRFLLFGRKWPLPEWIINGRIKKKPAGLGCVAQCFTGTMTLSTPEASK